MNSRIPYKDKIDATQFQIISWWVLQDPEKTQKEPKMKFISLDKISTIHVHFFLLNIKMLMVHIIFLKNEFLWTIIWIHVFFVTEYAENVLTVDGL